MEWKGEGCSTSRSERDGSYREVKGIMGALVKEVYADLGDEGRV